MKRNAILVALLLAVTPVFAGTKKIATINGVDIYRVKTCGLFCPSLTTLVAADPKRPGEISVLAHGANSGIVAGLATGGGIAGGAALLRPSRVSNNGGDNNVNTSVSGTGNVSGGNGWIPPGHR